MTAMWFGLAAIALVGAVVLLYIDRSRRDQLGRVRQMWAKAQGYTYAAQDDEIVPRFGRAALARPENTVAVDVVRGVRRGEKFVLFDIEESSTIVAVQRPVGSDVDIDLRLKSTPPPRDHDMELLGSIGPRVLFATDVEIARRVCDQRMAAFTESVPSAISLLWSENEWTLGSLSLGSTGRDWDAAIDAVARLSGMLHVLPPVTGRTTDRRTSAPRTQAAPVDHSLPGRPVPTGQPGPRPQQGPRPAQGSRPPQSPRPPQNPRPQGAAQPSTTRVTPPRRPSPITREPGHRPSES